MALPTQKLCIEIISFQVVNMTVHVQFPTWKLKIIPKAHEGKISCDKIFKNCIVCLFVFSVRVLRESGQQIDLIEFNKEFKSLNSP